MGDDDDDDNAAAVVVAVVVVVVVVMVGTAGNTNEQVVGLGHDDVGLPLLLLVS